jgi:hypothetical protein
MRPIAMLTIAVVLIPAKAAAQIPDKFENLQVLPKTISRAELIQTMKGFALGLGVRCEHCHVVPPGANPNTFQGMDFKADEKIEKHKARVMIKMVQTINGALLAELPARSDPPVTVQCVTCHRSSRIPKMNRDSL